jgi:ribosomal-protein-alanine N-acetyltransferase
MNTIFDSFPVLTINDNIVLRKINIEDDYKNFFYYITNPLVTKYLSSDDIPASIDFAKIELGYWDKMFDRKSSIYWAISLIKANKIIGTAGFNFWNQTQRRAEISYDLDPNFWSKGIMTSSIEAITNFALENMQVQRIQATVAIDNFSSIKVLEKNGYNQEGILKKYGYLSDQMIDFYMYAKTV